MLMIVFIFERWLLLFDGNNICFDANILINHWPANPGLNLNWCILIQISQKLVTNCAIDNKPASICLDSSLAPNRRQAFVWINDDTVYWRI